jgi:hypothetical protein
LDLHAAAFAAMLAPPPVSSQLDKPNGAPAPPPAIHRSRYMDF